MPASPIANYLNTLRRDLRAGDATERSHYPTLKALIESLAPGTTATVEPKWSDWGAPDFHVKNRAGLIIGHIEAKDVGKSLDDAERSEQLKDRYLKSVENLILTNFVEFRWYVRGREPGNARLGRFEAPAAIHALPADREGTLALLNSFFAHSPQGADDAKDLAVRLARYTHEIRNVVLAGFVHGDISDNVRALRDILKQDLVPDLTDEAFADMFAQTLTYGMFAAWCNHPDNTPFQRLGAAADIPKTNPLLRRVFELNTLSDMDDEPHAVYVDSVVQLLRLTDRAAILEDFARRTGREDPVVHFYETFLKEYDPKLRELRGVYYTPPAVISYMVRSVDHLLKTRFGIPNGLADTARTDFVRVYDHDRKEQASAPRVLILDPACGTGTFLYEIVNHIRDGFIRKRQAGAWRSYVREQLLPRLFGFELLMAPYAVAHLKLGLQLAAKDLPDAQQADYAYDFAARDRLGVYLTNTLEEARRRSDELFNPYKVVTDEANSAVDIKRDMPIMVVIGNPPYAANSANRGTWVTHLVRDAYYPTGKARERNPKLLLDDYVKFIRFAQWRVEKTGAGILAMITNHGYLDNPTFCEMRHALMTAFSDIYLIDLHGNVNKREVGPEGTKDENVFDIRQGVAIAIFVKTPGASASTPLMNHHDLWGSREAKYEWLQSNDTATTPWVRLSPQPPAFLFLPQDLTAQSEYEVAEPITTIMPLHSTGVKTHRDRLVFDQGERALLARIQRLRDLSVPDDAVAEELGVAIADRPGLADRRAALAADPHWDEHFARCLLRPFDLRAYYNHDVVVDRPRREVMDHMLVPGNLALVTTRQTRAPFAAFVARTPVIHKCITTYDTGYVLPLYLYPAAGQSTVARDQRIEDLKRLALGKGRADATTQRGISSVIVRLFPEAAYPRWPNYDPFLLARLEDRLALRFVPNASGDLAETFGPENVFDYIYAILHCPTYRARYAEFLKRGFPRIPFTSDKALFAALAGKGAELVALHLMESETLSAVSSQLTGAGDNRVERVHYNANEQRVYINKIQYFANVPTSVWGFHVGGYQVCEKWLKDRKGRPLTFDDQQHYQRITVALRETIRLMAEIDALIPEWPLP